MTDAAEVKRRVRALKRVEASIRFGGGTGKFVWDRFFDLGDVARGGARYTLAALMRMDRPAYKAVVDEFFAQVYFAYYSEHGFPSVAAYDPDALARLGLPFTAGEEDIKRRFRVLAKQCHPDVGGDANDFIELMEVYRSLIGK